MLILTRKTGQSLILRLAPAVASGTTLAELFASTGRDGGRLMVFVEGSRRTVPLVERKETDYRAIDLVLDISHVDTHCKSGHRYRSSKVSEYPFSARISSSEIPLFPSVSYRALSRSLFIPFKDDLMGNSKNAMSKPL